jgi:hypothetical protein
LCLCKEPGPSAGCKRSDLVFQIVVVYWHFR